PQPQYLRLAQLRASLDRLSRLPTAELERLMTETLDAFSHRLDVWISAVANSILQRQRTAQPPSGPKLHLGAYGWVENVRPAPPGAPLSSTDSADVARLDNDRARRAPGLSRALRRVVQPPARNGGFIHAPSMTQAAAAAVLRSGYMSHRTGPDEAVL